MTVADYCLHSYQGVCSPAVSTLDKKIQLNSIFSDAYKSA